MSTRSRHAKAVKRAVQEQKGGEGSLINNMVAIQDLLQRSRIMQRGGTQYRGQRDVFEVAGYIPNEGEKFSDYWALYERGDIAGRIVDMPAKTTWRTPPSFREEEQEDADDSTPFTDAVESLAKQVRLWHYLERVDRLAGIGQYAVLLIGVANTTDQELLQPLVSVRGPQDIIYLAPYSQANAKIEAWEADPGSPQYGLPKLYRLTTKITGGTQNTSELVVHASRVLHIAENLLEDEVFGRPRLKRCLNRLADLEKVAASTGEAYWQAAARILQATIDKDVEIADPDLKALDEKLGEMVHDLRRQFYGQGVDLKWLDTRTPDTSQVSEFYFSLIAGAAGIPKRILFGNEMGQLASTMDEANWLGTINERQEQFAEPMCVRAFVDRMIKIKAIKGPTSSKDYVVIWPTLFEESDTAKSTANLQRAQTASALTPVGGDPRELVTIDEEGMVTLIPREATPETTPGTPEPDPSADGTDELEPTLPDQGLASGAAGEDSVGGSS